MSFFLTQNSKTMNNSVRTILDSIGYDLLDDLRANAYEKVSNGVRFKTFGCEVFIHPSHHSDFHYNVKIVNGKDHPVVSNFIYFTDVRNFLVNQFNI